MKRPLGLINFTLLGICALLLWGSSAFAESRFALVIGNGAYKDSPLKNPPSDAAAMSKVLRDLGFEVIELIDVNQVQMKKGLSAFGERLKPDSVALFYYAGHGVQVKGDNWLIPVDAEIDSEADVEFSALSAQHVISKLEDKQSAVNIVILDACRNNPFSRGFRSAQRGLALMNAPRGSLIVYATGPGQVASDGAGSNSPFTQYLLQELPKRGQSIQDTILNVRVRVMADTGKSQIPWDASSMTNKFYPSGELSSNPQEALAELVKERTQLEELRKTSGSTSIPVGDMQPGQKLWVEPRAMYRDKDKKMFLRRDSVAALQPSATATMLLERGPKGYKADVTRCDYKWDDMERRGPQDPEVLEIVFSLRPAAMEKGRRMWATPASLFADSNRKLYLKGDAQMYPVRLTEAFCLGIERTADGYVADVTACPKKFQMDQTPGPNDLPLVDVRYK